MPDLAARHVEAGSKGALSSAIARPAPLSAIARPKGSVAIVEREGRGARNRPRHVRHAIMDDAVHLEGRMIVRRRARLSRSSRPDRWRYPPARCRASSASGSRASPASARQTAGISTAPITRSAFGQRRQRSRHALEKAVSPAPRTDCPAPPAAARSRCRRSSRRPARRAAICAALTPATPPPRMTTSPAPRPARRRAAGRARPAPSPYCARPPARTCARPPRTSAQQRQAAPLLRHRLIGDAGGAGGHQRLSPAACRRRGGDR